MKPIHKTDTNFFNQQVQTRVSDLVGVTRVTVGYDHLGSDLYRGKVVVELDSEGIEEEVTGAFARLKRTYDFHLIVLNLFLGGTVLPKLTPKIFSVGKNPQSCTDSFIRDNFPYEKDYEVVDCHTDTSTKDPVSGMTEVRLKSGNLLKLHWKSEGDFYWVVKWEL